MSGSSGAQFGRAAFRSGMVSRRQMTRWGLDHLRFRLRGASDQDTDELVKEIRELLAGVPERSLKRMVPDLLAGILPRIYPQMLDEVRAHQDAGRPAFIVSAAGHGVVELLAQVLDMEGGIGSRYEVDAEGRYTGELLGGLNYGELKIGPMRRFAAEHELDLDASWAYSDSVSDLPMLELVGNPVAVNPDAELARIADERGWRVMRFEKLGRRLAIAGTVLLAAALGGGGSWIARRRQLPAAARARIGAMDPTELAFAGIARQAELIRDRTVSSRELVDLYLERIERIEPRINGFRVVLAERAREEADESDRRVAAGESAPLLGVPIALKDEVDVAGELTTHGSAGFDRPATRRRLAIPASARGGRGPVRQDEPLQPGDLALHRDGGLGGDAQPLGSLAQPGRLQRRVRRRRSRRASSARRRLPTAAGRSGSRRLSHGLFGLKPQRGRISLSPEPQHWLGLSVTGPVCRRVADTALWLDVAAGPEPGDADTPPAPDRPLRRGCRAATRQPADRDDDAPPRARSSPAWSATRRARPSARRPPCWRRWGTRSRSATPTSAGSTTTPSRDSSPGSPTTAATSIAPSGSSAAPAGSSAWAGRSPQGRCGDAAPTRTRHRRADQPDLRRLRRGDLAGHRDARARDRSLGRPGRGADAGSESRGRSRSRCSGTTPASQPRRSRCPRPRPAACRGPSSSSCRRTARICCCRWARSSSTSSAGPAGSPRWRGD